MQYSVIGASSQCAVAQMTLGDEIRGEISAMVLLSDGVTLEAASGAASTHVGGLPALSSTVPLTHFRCISSLGVVTFAAPCPGEIRQLDLRTGPWHCSRDSFLFCSRDIVPTVGLAHQPSSGFFREHGYVLYRLTGHGDAYIHCGGSVIEYELVPGQRVSVDAGCVAAFQETVQAVPEAFEGLPSTHGGAESLFMMTLTGPGRIYLGTLPLSRMAHAAQRGRAAAPRHQEPAGGALGNLVKEL
jgi:uncharacterized protein (AIM24 family)